MGQGSNTGGRTGGGKKRGEIRAGEKSRNAQPFGGRGELSVKESKRPGKVEDSEEREKRQEPRFLDRCRLSCREE
jgi:hypothetical protein